MDAKGIDPAAASTRILDDAGWDHLRRCDAHSGKSLETEMATNPTESVGESDALVPSCVSASQVRCFGASTV